MDGEHASTPVQTEQIDVAVAETETRHAHAPVSPHAAAANQPAARRRVSFFPMTRLSSPPATADEDIENAAAAAVSTTDANKPPLKILVASWNVGNAMPPKDPQKLHEWIPVGGGAFDVVAIGLQESSYRERSSSVSSDVVPTDNGAAGSSSVAPNPETCANGSPTRREASRTDWDSECDEYCDSGNDDDDDDCADDDDELSSARADARRVARENSRNASSPQGSPRRGSPLVETESLSDQQRPVDQDTSSAVATGGDRTSSGGDRQLEGGDVIVKRSRTKKSMRKVSKLVRQVSSNLRDSVADALDYPFHRQLFHHLGDAFALVGKVELMEMRLFVYVHVRHAVSGIEKLSVPTGLGSVLGNKGGLVFKCVVQDTSLCFVSCHLAAHQDQKFLDKRNSDCASILGASIGMKHVALDHQFDHCFWFGDLNYRVDLNYTKTRDRTVEQHFAEVLAHVRTKQWDYLNANDQLRWQVEGKKALAGWTLPPALFPPTFKRVRYTPDEYNPQRIPSYCDRVLHKSLPGRRALLTLERFTCVEAIATSDHKPVLAEYAVCTARPVTVDATLASAQCTVVEITELAATDLLGMDMTGLSDPYIKFYSMPSAALQVESSGSHPSTATIMNTLSPTWRDDQVPKLRVLCAHETDVRLVHLVLLLMDYDTTSADDVLGVATIALGRFCHSKQPRFVPFEVPVTLNGKAAGTVSGKLRVALPHQVAALAGQTTRVLQHGRMATCACSVS